MANSDEQVGGAGAGDSKDVQGAPVRRVGDLSVDEFFGAMVQLMERRVSKGDARLMDMSMQEFINAMIEVTKSRSYQQAESESAVALRVFQDAVGLGQVVAASAPFRVRSAEEAQGLANNLIESFKRGGGIGAFAVAVAVVSESGGGYAPYAAPKLEGKVR